MSSATRPNRKISFVALFQTIFFFHFKHNLLSKKAIILGLVSCLPVLGGVLYLLSDGEGGLSVFRGLVEYVNITFLLPLICLFLGGPAVVEEIEGKTITYLFLRPVSKPAIFLGKYTSASLLSALLGVLPVVPLYFVCMMAGGDIGENMQLFAQVMVSLLVGAFAYTAVFACLSAMFAKSLLSGLVFWGVFEWLLSLIPVLEFGSVKYHLRNAASLVDLGKLGPLDRMLLNEAIEVPIWASYGALGAVVLGALVLGSWVFQERQYFM